MDTIDSLLDRAGRGLLNVMAVLVILLMLAVTAQVVFSYFGLNPVAGFSRSHVLVGQAISLNSLLDAQWHLFAIICLVPSGAVLLRDTHVRVDFLYDRCAPGTRDGINLLGHGLFAAPFFVMALPAAWDFVQRAFRSGEGSRNGGLNDLWIIKLVLPLGLGLLAAAVLWESIRILRRWSGP